MNKKLVLFFVMIFIGIIAFTDLLAHTNTFPMGTKSYYTWEVKQEMVALLTDRADTVIFGDSTAHGSYYPDAINSHVFNFALDAATPVEGYFFLKYMISQGKHPKNIVLEYMPVRYYRNFENYWDAILEFNLKVFTRSDAEEILSVDKNSAFQLIKPYSASYQNDSRQNVANIPYYYDVAIGALNHVKLDFDHYIEFLYPRHQLQSTYLKSRGSPILRIDGEIPPQKINNKFCDKPRDPTINVFDGGGGCSILF